MNFNDKYTKYWEHSTSKSIDGLKIPGEIEAAHMLNYLNISKSDKILDLGCSFGRMFKVLNKFSNNIYGVEPDKYAINKANKFNYVKIFNGTAENTGFANKFFDLIFSWQVFDVVDQFNALVECNRVLKLNGHILFTGKNNNYKMNDEFAFKAEKNAFIKKFPNRFTNLKILNKNIDKIGFKVIKLFLFPKRGDFGLLNYSEKDSNNENFECYEYLLICKKISELNNISGIDNLTSKTSLTSERIASQKGFISAKDLFQNIGID